jgi:hypothetical protein
MFRTAVQRSIYQCVSKEPLLGCVLTSLSEKSNGERDFRFNAKLSNEFGV